ncbi:hypothetical protein FIBSPDRAFT_847870 [Athelia psychrophila]|uniref:Uncharacterized protein n=1 Tax=Athelia psychrophila TaxID=1759441 RepID=A0A166W0G2_9AGAM|nr:hypothetical protein FIBSPDRAFT_847870 [Fibularhizoctonia sp. CBS 109695]
MSLSFPTQCIAWCHSISLACRARLCLVVHWQVPEHLFSFCLSHAPSIPLVTVVLTHPSRPYLYTNTSGFPASALICSEFLLYTPFVTHPVQCIASIASVRIPMAICQLISLDLCVPAHHNCVHHDSCVS